MNRNCPSCANRTIPVKELLFGDYRCPECGEIGGVHWVASTLFNIVIFVATVTSTLVVLIDQGLYAALLWFTLPIGALCYVKARFSPLETKSEPLELNGASDS